MRIGLNLLYLIPGVVGGTETYASGLLNGFSKLATRHEFLIYINRETANWPLPYNTNFKPIVCPVGASNRVERYFFEQLRLPLLLRRHKVDIVHSLGYVGPVISPSPTIVSIPDLNFIDQADTMPLSRRFGLNLVSRLSAATAEHIITISHFSKQRLCSQLSLPANKITVTHLAHRPQTINNSDVSWSDLRQRYGICEPYLVAFGGGTSHKNITTLLNAFRTICESLPHSLVLIGHLSAEAAATVAQLKRVLPARIVITGYVPDKDVYPLLSHADLFVLPSLYEGFGLPILEAQYAGVAVASSNVGSLPEVGGKGAVYFDPNSTEEIAQAIIHCLSDEKIRQDLCRRAKMNLSRFSWEKTALQTLRVYNRVSKLN